MFCARGCCCMNWPRVGCRARRRWMNRGQPSHQLAADFAVVAAAFGVVFGPHVGHRPESATDHGRSRRAASAAFVAATSVEQQPATARPCTVARPAGFIIELATIEPFAATQRVTASNARCAVRLVDHPRAGCHRRQGRCQTADLARRFASSTAAAKMPSPIVCQTD